MQSNRDRVSNLSRNVLKTLLAASSVEKMWPKYQTSEQVIRFDCKWFHFIVYIHSVSYQIYCLLTVLSQIS